MSFAVLMLALGLLVTAVSARWVWTTTEHDAWQRFDMIAERVRSDAAQRMTLFTYGLESCRGLFIGSERVSRKEFSDYSRSREFKAEFVGALGIGFIERVPRAMVDDWVKATREDGCPEFELKSSGEHPELRVIKYIEPVEDNWPAVGFDIAVDPLRTEAAERAMRTGMPEVTSAVTLLQDALGRRGVLYFLPVYRPGTDPKTESERVEQCVGWAYSPIVLDEALASVTAGENGMVDIEVFDGATPRFDRLIYDNDDSLSTLEAKRSPFERNSPLTMGGRRWTLHITGHPAFDKTAEPVQATAVGLCGTIMSLMMSWLVWMLSTSRGRAVALATGMTAELKRAKDAAEQSLREQAASLQLTATLAGAIDVNAAVNAVMAAIAEVTGIDRCAVLLCPGKGEDAVCQFLGSTGLSEEYRKAFEGSCPWKQDGVQTQLVLIENVAAEPSLFAHAELLARERIGTMAVIPVRTEGGVAGKLMLFHAMPGAISRRVAESALVLGGFLGMTMGRLRAQAQTRDSENLFRLLVEGGDEFVNLMTTDRKPIYISPSYFRITGWTPEDFKGSHWTNRVHPEDRELVLRTREENIAGKATRIEYRTLKKDGTAMWLDLRATPVMDATGTKVERILSFSRDITEAKQAEQRLRESEHRMRAIIDGTGVIAWEFDFAAGRFTYVSPSAASLGYPLEDWFKPGFWQDHIHPDDRDVTVKTCIEESKAGRNHRFQYRLMRADGTPVWMDDFVSVEMRGSEVGVLRGVLIDITEARRLTDMAEAANAAKSEFLANMSHEIRTPLTAILGYTEMLVEDGDVKLAPSRRMESLATIRKAGEHLLTVVNDILDISKIEAGRLKVEELECDLPGVLSEVASLMGARAKEKQIELRVELGNAVPMKAVTDPTRLRQILLNLVGNAVKFTDHGGVTVHATFTESSLCVDIADTGPGMSEEQATRLFSPFTQADASVTRKHGGTGLGLTICRRLAALMGGSVILHRTAPGEGSVFRVVIPMKVAPGIAWTKTLDVVSSFGTPTEVGSRLSGRILLAEDGVDNQRLISFHLKKAGAEVDIVENGSAALRLLTDSEPGRYQLLLSDMQMPEMDGYTLARTLRERGSRIPIVALTAHAMAEDRHKCLSAGCDDYATKPIDSSALIATCAAWMGREGGLAQRRAA